MSIFEDELKAFEKLEKAFEQSVKAPEVIGIPQERITGDILRGRGPRRGNLEDLLKYWRPIMKKPGGFRRCVVILADKPKLYPPQRICAWLHHEITGKWPNEGNHHGRKKKKPKARKVTRKIRKAARKAKSDDFVSDTFEVSEYKMALKESRDFGGVLYQPIAGRQAAVEFKAAMFNKMQDSLPANIDVKRVGTIGSSNPLLQAAQGIGTAIAPGNVSDISVWNPRRFARSQVYEALTPGGGRARSRIRRLVRGTGRGARNKFRCPPGFEKGGTFTDSQFSTCGAQILAVPRVGPGSPSGDLLGALSRLFRMRTMFPEVGKSRGFNISAATNATLIQPAPKKNSYVRQQQALDLLLTAYNTESLGARIIRRDGLILEPAVSFAALGKLDEFDDLADGSLLIRDRAEKNIGRDAVQAFSTGLRDIYVAIPDVGAIRIYRDGGELSPEELGSLKTNIQSAVSRAADIPDPTAFLRNFSEITEERFKLDFGEVSGGKFSTTTKEMRELVRVQSGDQVQVVPRWVYETFLSRSAPRRPKSAPVFEVIENGKKALDPSFRRTHMYDYSHKKKVS